jgi:preprotein translocase subunit SecE
MAVKKEDTKNHFDIVKWIVVILLAIAGFVANYFFLKIPWPIRVVGGLVLLCIMFAIVLQTIAGRRLWRFVKDSRGEMRKVVWPSRQQTFQMTLMVIAIIIAFALVMWGVDSILLWAVSWLTG